jgi:PAS domain S-box-containing protein
MPSDNALDLQPKDTIKPDFRENALQESAFAASTTTRYGLTICAIAASSLLRWFMPDVLGRAPYLGFYPAVVVSAILGGVGPGLVATFGSLLLVNFVFVQFDFLDYGLQMRNVIWILSSVGVSFLAEKLRLAHRHLQQFNLQLEQRMAERQRAEDSLRESERFYRQTLESIPGMVFTTRPDGYCDYQSQQWVDFTGVPMEEHLGDGWNKLLHPEDRPRAYAAWRAAVEERAPYDLEYRVRRHDGQYEWFKVRGVPIRDAAGQIDRWFGVAINIEAIKRAEEASRESEARLRLAHQVARIGSFEWDLRKNLTKWSPELETLYGLPLGVFGGNYEEWAALVHPDDLPEIEKRLRESLEKGQLEAEWRVLRPDGTIRWVAARGQVFKDEAGNPLRMIGVNLDITERKQAEEALEKVKGTLAEGQKIAHVGTFEYVIDTQKTVWSEEEYRIYGLDPAGPSPAYDVLLAKCLHPDDAALLHQTFMAAMQNQSVYELEHRIVRPDGSIRVVYDRANPYFDENGKLVRYIGATLDITDRKHAEEELRKSEYLRRMAQEITRVGTFEWNIVTGVNTWTPELEALYGLPPGGFAGTQEAWEQLVHPEDRARAVAAVQRAFEKSETVEDEWRVIWSDGTTHWLAGRFRILRNEKQKPLTLTGVNIDMTERKQAEEALKKSLGEKEVLLKEIHHRVKNNMQVISSLVDLQADQVGNAEIKAVLQDVTHRVRSMALVHEKLYQSADMARVEFAEYAEGLLHYLWRAHGTSSSGIRLSLDLEPVALSVNAAVPCGLILNELASNALKHAFRDGKGGVVAVSLRADPEGRVHLKVRDNGAGLPKGLDWRRSKSLGLQLVQIFSQQLHADVNVSASEGTEFMVSFGGPKQ